MRRPGRMRRGPGLLGAAARTAVVVGTASAVSGRVDDSRRATAQREQEGLDARRELARREQQEQVDAQVAAALAQQRAAPVAGTGDVLAQLRELGELRAAGVLTEDEFATQKARILGA